MKKKLLIYLYYALLLLVMVTRKDSTTEPSMLLRVLFLLAVVLPTFMNRSICFPAILSMFFGIALNGFSYSYMPYTYYIYVLITLVFLLFHNRVQYQKHHVPKYLVTIGVYCFFVDFIFGTFKYGISSFNNLFLSIVILACFILIVFDNIEMAIAQLPLCFAVSTIVLCVVFFLGREQFTTSYYLSGLDRTRWTDPNYFGMFLGMGSVSGLLNLFGKDWRSLGALEKFIYVAAIVISLPILVLNGSRGALLAIFVALIVLLIISKVKMVYKVLFIAIAAFGIMYLYSNQYFDLLLYRIANDDGTGSYRTLIWKTKLHEYLNGGIINMLFGYGQYGGAKLGISTFRDMVSGEVVGFHNDYIGFLVDYGVIGFGLFIYFLLYPIILVEKGGQDNIYVLIIIIYLSTCFLTLEPIITGVLSYFVFYLYALLIAIRSRALKKASNIIL